MSVLERTPVRVPAGAAKLLYLDWALALLLVAVATFGVLMLYSVAGGAWDPWAGAQVKRFAVGFALMVAVAMVPIGFWRTMAAPAYAVSVLLLIAVEVAGTTSEGAQRWLDLGGLRLQPSELTKITLVMALAAYYDRLAPSRISHPVWVALPVALILLPVLLVLRQPDLGTAILLLAGGAAVMFVAGVHWLYFAVVAGMGGGAVASVFLSRGTEWQVLRDYQYRRIDTFLDPSSDPLGAGYHITQSKIALGSGGLTGRGYMQGTQSRLNFLPEKHTDFIFTTLAEEFGFVGGMSLLALYTLILGFCVFSALTNTDRFSQLLTLGIAATLFLFFSVNMSMIMGLAPVVGVPLPLVSYGGSAMLVLMGAFGLVQSAHVHKARTRR